MRTTLYVISDLHLGGTPANEDCGGFQICGPATHRLLVDFIDRIPASKATHDHQLVIAGDIVDFLAEEPFEAFTPDPTAALEKFDRILTSTILVWEALNRFVTQRHGALTLMLGNHDIELCLPGVRRRLRDAIGPGRVEFVDDNCAFTLGPVLVEHGNRYDAWNAVPHDALRRVRSQLSRSLAPAPVFPGLPGSRLVVEVMNPLKRRFAFVDLLKPEDAAALPILASLGAAGIGDVWKAFRQYRQTWSRDFDESGEPKDPSLVAAGNVDDQNFFNLAQEIAADNRRPRPNQQIAPGRIERIRRDNLFRAIRACADRNKLAFTIDSESEIYLRPARRLSKAGYSVVIFGHTHHVKRVAIQAPGNKPSVYLNTGTWADLMSIPPDVFGESETDARRTFDTFVTDLEHNAIAHWRRQVATYAKVELHDNHVEDADIFFADGLECERVTDAGLTRRLAGESHE